MFIINLYPNSDPNLQASLLGGDDVDSGEGEGTLDSLRSQARPGLERAGYEIKLEDTSGLDVQERLDKMNLMLQV